MTNKNYVKGRAKEYKIRNLLIKEGWDIVQRTAGSHSPIDVIAINKLTRTIKFIQSKPENFSETEKNKIKNELSWLNNVFRCEFELL